VRCHFHTGPKSDVTNLKKNQNNARSSHVIILNQLDMGKIQTLIKAIYQKFPSQKWPTAFEVVWLLGQMS
jgi:hypothetical protein